MFEQLTIKAFDPRMGVFTSTPANELFPNPASSRLMDAAGVLDGVDLHAAGAATTMAGALGSSSLQAAAEAAGVRPEDAMAAAVAAVAVCWDRRSCSLDIGMCVERRGNASIMIG